MWVGDSIVLPEIKAGNSGRRPVPPAWYGNAHDAGIAVLRMMSSKLVMHALRWRFSIRLVDYSLQNSRFDVRGATLYSAGLIAINKKSWGNDTWRILWTLNNWCLLHCRTGLCYAIYTLCIVSCSMFIYKNLKGLLAKDANSNRQTNDNIEKPHMKWCFFALQK
jgi:hypothetical protein